MFKKIFSFLKKRWYVLAVLLVVGGIFYYRSTNIPSPTKKETPYTVKRQDLKDTLSLSGKIDAEEKATLRFQTSGRLAWVGVKEGDYVKKYQSVASLDQREVKKKLDKTLTDYLNTRWSFEQTKDNNNQGQPITTALQRILDQNQFGLNKSVLDVEIQNLSMEFANLWTPIEGIVTKVDSPFAGVNITPAQAEFEVVNPKTVYFSATADQVDVVKLPSSGGSEITFDAYPDKIVKGKIKAVSFSPKSGETGTVYEVKIALNEDNSDYHYRLGMTGDASFVLKQKDKVLSIPSSYIKSEQGKKYVMKKKGDKKIKAYVTLGEEIGDAVEIKEGLNEGDIIY